MQFKECIMYLRKSRADRDFIEDETEQTLKRHEEDLRKLAKQLGLHIVKTYREIISGDSIAARPEVQKVLTDVETGNYYGVIVHDIYRLARGNSIDQGIIQNTFKYSDTRIITPMKVYDFSDEFDEEYSEFELFMGRKELKTTKRRLLNGRLASIREGKWPGGNAPYGYEVYKLKGQKGYSLRSIPEQAKIVNLIYNWYVYGVPQEDGSKRPAGSYVIANKLNCLGYTNQYGRPWNECHITKIIGYEVYIGKVVWYKRKEITRMENGRIIKSSTCQTDDVKLVADGLHDGIIDEDLFYKAIEIKNNRRPHTPKGRKMRNPFSGVLICQKCGKPMWLRSKDRYDYSLFCHNVNCDNKAVYLSVFEDKFISALQYWTDGYLLDLPRDGSAPASIDSQIETMQNQLLVLEDENKKLQAQLLRAYDLVETGVYDPETFSNRSVVIKNNLAANKVSSEHVQNEISHLQNYIAEQEMFVPKLKSLVESYKTLDVSQKQEIISKLFDRIEYVKHKWGRGHQDDFEIELYPKLPKL